MNNKTFDLHALRIIPKNKTLIAIKQKERLGKVKGRFLKGPISMDWLERVGQCPGKAMQVAIAIWHMVGMTGERTIKIPKAVLQKLGVNRYALHRALPAMEKAGVISVVKRSGASPEITVLAL